MPPRNVAPIAATLALALAATLAPGLGARTAGAQTTGHTPAQTPAQAAPLEIGAVAPDFELPGATRFGTLQQPVRLSDYQGKTVVLAFFFRARTPG
jgi:hypothetical protein